MLTFKYDYVGDYNECEFVSGMIPANGVYENAFIVDSAAAFTQAAAGTVLNARAIKTEGTSKPRVFLGSATKIEELTGYTTIADRSKSGGYSNNTGWSFSQGIAANEVVAANIGYAIQVSTGSTFADLTNAPKASIVLAQSKALLALNYIDSNGSFPNGIKITTRGSSTTWDADNSNEAATAKLVETPGEIYAGATLNDLVVVWKRNSMYVGRFVGGSEKWQFNLFSPYIGCYGKEAWVTTPAGIIFTGPAGTYIFDGSVPREIDQGVRQLISDYVSGDNDFGINIQMSHDEYSSCVFMWIPEAINGEFVCFAYNYRDGRWSFPYPMTDIINGVRYDFGLAAPTGFQAVVRDLTLFDYNVTTERNIRYVGHFIVAGDKKVYNLSFNSFSTGDPEKYCCRVVSGRIKLPSAPPDTDLVLRRVYPIFGSGRFLTTSMPLPGDVLKCVVTAYPTENYSRGSAFSTKEVDFDTDGQRFDTFVTGKMFKVNIYGAAGIPFCLKDLKFDIVPVGKT
jgi:hypothetical protein